MPERARPPDDISPHEFFTSWVPTSVATDEERRARLGDTFASMVFILAGESGGEFTLEIAAGHVSARVGRANQPDLEIHIDVETWRQLNRGDLTATEALLRRRLKLTGNLVLALKLHLILG
jgi:putative sterol carrier protein